jgi:hypothetical protein
MPRSWLSGYYGAGDPGTRSAWEQVAGSPATVWTTFCDYETSWSDRAADVVSRRSQYSPPVSDHSAVNVLTLGLILSGSGGSQAPNLDALTNAAHASDVDGWTQVAQAIQSLGLNSPSTVIRLGHEPNGNWYPWSTNNDPNAMTRYRQAFQHAHDAVKAVCPLVRFDMCLNVGNGGLAAIAGHYPGDAYVDIMGLDFYDYAINKSIPQFVTSQNHCGFTDISAFAIAHRKKFALNEWALGTNPDVVVRDNPFYVASIYNALSTLASMYGPNFVDHDSYFNSPGNHNLSANPLSQKVYRQLWAPLVTAS